MTTQGRSKQFASTTSSATIDISATFNVRNWAGQVANEHAGFWLSNMDTTAANIIWWRPDATAATVAGDDCYPLRPGERVYVRKVDFISYIAAAATPPFWVGGDMSGVVYS